LFAISDSIGSVGLPPVPQNLGEADVTISVMGGKSTTTEFRNSETSRELEGSNKDFFAFPHVIFQLLSMTSIRKSRKFQFSLFSTPIARPKHQLGSKVGCNKAAILRAFFGVSGARSTIEMIGVKTRCSYR
jgi:hypothetical protein